MLSACSPDELQDSGPTADSALLTTANSSGTTMLLELETISRTTVTGPGPDPSQEWLTESIGQPHAERQKMGVHIGIGNNFELVTEAMEPRRHEIADPFAEVPPSSLPPTHRTVFRDGQLSLYTKSGDLLYRQPMEVEQVLSDDVQRILGEYDYLAEANKTGAKVEAIGEDTYIIHRPVTLEEYDEELGLQQTTAIQEEVVVADLNLLLGMGLATTEGEQLSRTTFRYTYSDAAGRWLPETSYSTFHEVDPTTGSQLTTRVTSYFDNLSIHEQK